MQQRQVRLAQFHALLDDHTHLTQRLHELHERYLVLESDPDVTDQQRRAQTAAIIHAEGEVLEQAQQVVQGLQQLLGEHD